MWRTYFPHAHIVGLDLFAKDFDEPRITTVQGDQGDGSLLSDLAEQWGPFDLIVDDGSHINEHVISTIDTLFPFVREGGIYAIEDVETAYWQEIGGGPPGTAGTSIAYVISEGALVLKAAPAFGRLDRLFA